MRNLMFAVTIAAVGAIAPISAHASEQPLLIQQTAPAAKDGSDVGKAFAIGSGIVVAATAASLLSFRGVAIILAGAAGGLAGAWWYGSRSEFATLEPRKP